MRPSDLYHSKIFLVIILLAILFLGFKLIKIVNSTSKVDLEISNLKNQIKTIEEDNERLKNEITSLSNPEYIKKEARKRFNLQEEEEKVIIIKE